jgi:hypothetical protein
VVYFGSDLDNSDIVFTESETILPLHFKIGYSKNGYWIKDYSKCQSKYRVKFVLCTAKNYQLTFSQVYQLGISTKFVVKSIYPAPKNLFECAELFNSNYVHKMNMEEKLFDEEIEILKEKFTDKIGISDVLQWRARN